MKNYLKNQIIYQVYVRNFTKEGTFNAFNHYIKYIKDLGTDIIYFLPVNTIGKKDRKGDLGSPYSIKDYYEINSELGSLEDFKNTINLIRKENMKVMIDIVFNHTSKDSVLLNKHPKWFYKDKNGNINTKASDWTDVYDLNYLNNDELVNYLVDVIKYYIDLGIDGFRFDVASMVGVNFYQALKEKVLSKHPEIIMLGEAIDLDFNNYLRSEGFKVCDDPTLYQNGFDLLYQYNNFKYLKEYLETNNLLSLTKFKLLKSYEYAFNPENALRIREIENHDQKRIIEYTTNPLKMRNIAAYSFYMVGPAFVYNGLETKANHHLSLFTKDLLDLSIDEEWFNFIKKLLALKKDENNLNIIMSEVSTEEGENLLIKNIYKDSSFTYGIFNLKETSQTLTSTFLNDGLYLDLISNQIIEIKSHTLTISEPLYLVKYEK